MIRIPSVAQELSYRQQFMTVHNLEDLYKRWLAGEVVKESIKVSYEKE